MDDMDFAVLFPVSPVAKGLLSESQLQPDEDTLQHGLHLIKNALSGKPSTPAAISKEDKLQYLASYASARMILGFARNNFFTNRFAVVESKRMANQFQRHPELIGRIAADFGISFEPSPNGVYFLVPLPAYLRSMPDSTDYALVGRDVSGGRVRITPYERIRLIEESIKKHLMKVKAPKDSDLKRYVDELKEFLPKMERQPVSFKEGDNPPCVEALLTALKKHENLGHQARWLLAVYLIARGLPLEKIDEMFSQSPDYSERTTRYQLKHAKERNYSVPSCSTILGWGLCVSECRIGSPLNWRGKGGLGRPEGGGSSGEKEKEGGIRK